MAAVFAGWARFGAAILVSCIQCVGAGVELRPGTVVECASVEEGQRILGARDAFIQAMSQFDRCVRMKTSRLVAEAEFLSFLTNQVRGWTVSEQAKVSNAVVSIRGRLAAFDLRFPDRIPFVKTTGSEEGGAAYCRSGCVILPQGYLNQSATALRDIIIHVL